VLWPRVGTASSASSQDCADTMLLAISFLIRPVERGYDAASGCGSPPIHCQAPLCRGHRRAARPSCMRPAGGDLATERGRSVAVAVPAGLAAIADRLQHGRDTTGCREIPARDPRK
jgi:hypothetical protein